MRNIIISICVLFLLLLLAICYGFQQEHHVADYTKDSNKEATVNSLTCSFSQDSLCPSEEVIVDNYVASKHPEVILHREAYTISFNSETHNANWVGWHLTKEHLDGNYSRKGVPYYCDDGVACGIGRVTSETCKGSYFADVEVGQGKLDLDDWSNNAYGMSHGHLCPTGDCKWSAKAMNQSFLLTNMCPQHPSLNNGAWRVLEELCRKWARKHGDIYIVAGPIFVDNTPKTFGETNIAVPDAFFKVIFILKAEVRVPEIPSEINTTVHYKGNKAWAIGFVYPNDGTNHSMQECCRSLKEIETLTKMCVSPDMAISYK